MAKSLADILNDITKPLTQAVDQYSQAKDGYYVATETYKGDAYAAINAAKAQAQADLEAQRAAVKAQLVDEEQSSLARIQAEQTSAQNDIDARARNLDQQFAGFLTGAVPRASAGYQAGVQSRDALGLSTSGAPVPEEKPSALPILLVAGLGYYFFLRKKGRH